MKAILNKLFLFLSVPFLLLSCQKDETRLIATEGTSPQLTVVQHKQVMLEEESADTAIAFSWAKADFGFSAAITYSLQFAPKGTAFASPRTVALSNALQRKYTVGEFNTIANEIGLEGFVEQEMEVRVMASISAAVTPVYSNTLTVTITPYLAEPEYPVIFMVGDATEGEWDNTKGTAMFRDEEDVFIYTFTGYFKAGSLKFLGVSGMWAPQWGNDNAGGVSFRPTEQDDDLDPFTVATAGYYTVNLSLRTNTFSMTPYDASAAPVFASIGTIGTFNSWAGINPMTTSAFNPHVWKIKQTFGGGVEFKFRTPADDWSDNWGPASKSAAAALRGVAVRSSAENYTPEAGTYQIYFNDLTGHYVFVKE